MQRASQENERLERILLQNLHARLPAMRELLEQVNRWNCYKHQMYKFYFGSLMVFEGLQAPTRNIVDLLTEAAPEGRGFNLFFRPIIAAEMEQKFGAESNEHWDDGWRFVKYFDSAQEMAAIIDFISSKLLPGRNSILQR